jgi:Trk-type K+ transport system membrane component
MAGIGPGLGASGNMGNYAHFNPVARITMILLMICRTTGALHCHYNLYKAFRRN